LLLGDREARRFGPRQTRSRHALLDEEHDRVVKSFPSCNRQRPLLLELRDKRW